MIIRLLVLTMVAGAGCKKDGKVDGHRIAPGDWKKQSKEIMSKATFDLDCNEEITLTVLETQRVFGYPPLASSVGATGCGKRGRYERVPADISGKWVLNSVAN